MRYEASNTVFVAMPFTKPFERAYDAVIKPAIESVTVSGIKLQPRIINRGTTGSPDIHEHIYDAIIHSRLVVADMTVQSSYKGDDGRVRWHANANVAYEVGLACSWRNPEDILLIHQEHAEHSYGFDIQNLRHVQYKGTGPESVRAIAAELVSALNQSSFIANQSYLKIVQSLSPSAIQFMHQESRRGFPIIAFSDGGMPIMDCRVHAATELLSCGALKNRNVLSLGSGKGVTIIYQWTELGLRMLMSVHAVTKPRQLELREQIASVQEGAMPPQKLLEFPVPEKTEPESQEPKPA